MKKIGFLGCGKIGKKLLQHIKADQLAEVAFIEDPFASPDDLSGELLIRTPSEEYYSKADLIVECATAAALKEHIKMILKYADLLMFSVTSFSDDAFCQEVTDLTSQYGHHVYLPHGAILGLDGIFDGRKIWKEVSVVTTKSPKSLGLTLDHKQVVYDGPTRGACAAFPRNVNVHASIALAGIGLDKTHSTIIADPAVSTNSHKISLKGDGIDITMDVSSYAAGAVSGAYTPHSACGSLDRILKKDASITFV